MRTRRTNGSSSRIKKLALAILTAAAGTLSYAADSQAQALDRTGLITVTDHENGNLRNEVLLPCGQAYVEIFQRKNGVQVTAQNITSSQKAVGGGYCTYSLVTGGFTPFELVETRFYSYLPASPGVFTPGPEEQVWVRYNYGLNPIGARSGAVQPGDLLIADLGGGRARFDMIAPSGQAYVEVFARQNGIQNVAGGITGTETPIGNGFSRYSRNRSGYSTGDFIEFREYNFLPATPGVFFPGPSPANWKEYTYGDESGQFFETADVTYDLDARAGLDVDVYFGHATSNIVRVFTGWFLDRGVLPSLTVPLKAGLNAARLVQAYIRRCDTGEWIPLSDVPAFDYSSATELGVSGLYQFKPTPSVSQLPGTRVDPTYECGGFPTTIPTIIGPVTLTTRAKVHYAYVVQHFNFGR